MEMLKYAGLLGLVARYHETINAVRGMVPEFLAFWNEIQPHVFAIVNSYNKHQALFARAQANWPQLSKLIGEINDEIARVNAPEQFPRT